MSENADKLTPMFEQYKSIKRHYPDALLFFRMGDFYELFFDDAITASRELQIALTSRGRINNNPIPMCGVPWHASQTYLAQLIDRGYNIAICEQVEDPKACKGLVARAVTRVITPGTVLEETNLAAKTHNYLGSVFCGMHNSCAFVWADISTGQWSGVQFKRQADLWQWVRKLAPSELLIVDGQQLPGQFNADGIRLVHQAPVVFDLKRSTERILKAQGVQDLSAVGLEGKPEMTRACGAILAYLEQTQLKTPDQLMPFEVMDLGSRLIVDEITERNLEIFVRQNGLKGKGTLRGAIDMTLTPMGGRFLEDMLRHPWRDMKNILQIQDCVEFFYLKDSTRASLRKLLEKMQDLERLIMRIIMGRSSEKDLFAFRSAIDLLPKIRKLLTAESDAPPLLKKILVTMDDLEDCSLLLHSALLDNPESADSEKSIFKPGYNLEYDRQGDLAVHGEEKLQALLAREQAESGLAKMKLGYNRVFGYYFEISRSNLDKGVPEHFARRQTLVNAERFVTGELKELEDDILSAAEKRKEMEAAMMENLRGHLAAQKERTIHCADTLAQIDYWQSLAEIGKRENWVRPQLSENSVLQIEQGRHPVIEGIIGASNFVPNDIILDNEHRLCLITGPNMAGKSTILRQVAIICLLAQMGSMVPAKRAIIGIVDRLFSRVGASDNLAQGQSTFMVEMMETARILRQAGRRSLVILDEIGRGTSTYDGMALAWAVVEELAARAQGQTRTLFATHYHELTSLEGEIPGIFTMNVSVGEYGNNEILFLHRLLPGPSDKSYGVEVARLAGVPGTVVQRARDLLKTLEQKKSGLAARALTLPGMKEKSSSSIRDTFFTELNALDLQKLSPEDALTLLQNWKKRLKKN